MGRYKAEFQYFTLIFNKPSGTSRGILTEKPSWLLKISDQDTELTGTGEISIIPDLSPDPVQEIETLLYEIISRINRLNDINLLTVDDDRFPAVSFGIETAILDLKNGGNKVLFNNNFSRGEEGIPINGLVWMENIDNMFAQAKDKIESGFDCLKFKVGALPFEDESALIKRIRKEFGNKIQIRLDANGGFTPENALEKLKYLSDFDIHSIEQPIRQGQWDAMQKLCEVSPVPIALDEELIGIMNKSQKLELLNRIHPQYIILKPSLIGGLKQADEWIDVCNDTKTGWWATSALESNIGLNAIAQWVAGKKTGKHQGLGTGSLFKTNYPLPLFVYSGRLWYGNNATA